MPRREYELENPDFNYDEELDAVADEELEGEIVDEVEDNIDRKSGRNVDRNVEYTSLQDAFTYAKADETIQLLADIDSVAKAGIWPLSVAGNKDFTLDLAGHVIDRGLTETEAAGNGSVLQVSGSLTLIDTIPNSTHTNTELPAGGVITGGKTKGECGGVCLNINASFTMNGGTIYGNQASKYSGGVYINRGTMTMTGGAVKGNSTNGHGGGIVIYSMGNSIGSFTMSGGEVSGNTADDKGGGVFVGNDGSFTISGGKCSNSAGSLAT